MCQEVKDFSKHTFHLVYIWYTDSYERCCSSKIISNTNQWVFTKLGMCIDIEIEEIWLGIANEQISSIFDELSAYHTFIFLFLNDNLSKCQWIFAKLGIVIVEIWFGTADGLNSSIFDRYLPTKFQYFHFPTMTITWVNINGFSQNLVHALILWRSGLGLQMGKLHQLLTELSAQHTMSGYYHFTFLLYHDQGPVVQS